MTVNTRLSTSNKAIVADLLQSEHHITIKYVKTQYQKGYSDCGLFAIVNAVAICHGLSPEYLKYDQNSMRGHCRLQNKFLSPFPAGKADRKNVIQKEKIYVCGSCRMFEEEQMLECVKCEKKFHLRCVTDKIFKEQEEWYLWGVLCWMEGRSRLLSSYGPIGVSLLKSPPPEFSKPRSTKSLGLCFVLPRRT